MPPRRSYGEDKMEKALKEVRLGSSLSYAARTNDVPLSTLHKKSKEKNPTRTRYGPATILTYEEEELLVEYIIELGKNHFALNRNDLLYSVHRIIKSKPRPNPFKNDKPGKKWFSSFMKRHPELSERTPQHLTKARENVTEQQIRNWFSEVEEYLKSKNLLEVMEDKTRVFNADESAFFFTPENGKVLVKRGEKNVYVSAPNDEKENLTVLVTANAAGKLAPPMIVFDYKRMPGTIVKRVPDGWGIGKSDTGWMTGKTFYEYFANVFEPWLENQQIARPVIFFLDGHRSHLTLHLSDFCKAHDIELIALYPNSTHICQPMDYAVFSPLKAYWKDEVTSWRMAHIGKKLENDDFGPVFQRALNQVGVDTISNGFRATGLCPFSPENVNYDKMSTDKRNRPNSSKAEDTVKDSAESCKNILSFLEAKLPKEKLKAFEENIAHSNHWEGEDKDFSLFNLWKELKETESGKKIEIILDDPIDENAVQNDDTGSLFDVSSEVASPSLAEHFLGDIIEFTDLTKPPTDIENHSCNSVENLVLSNSSLSKEVTSSLTQNTNSNDNKNDNKNNNINDNDDSTQDLTLNNAGKEEILSNSISKEVADSLTENQDNNINNNNNDNDNNSAEDLNLNNTVRESVASSSTQNNSVEPYEVGGTSISETYSKSVKDRMPSPLKNALFWPEEEPQKKK